MAMTTTTGLEDGQIIKTDVLGRVLMSRQRREALLEEFERSGMSGSSFAQWAGIKYQTFALWARKRRGARKAVTPQVPVETKQPSQPGSAKSLRWVEAVVDQAPKSVASGGAGLVMHLPCGARMEIRDERGAMLATEVLRQLQKASGC